MRDYILQCQGADDPRFDRGALKLQFAKTIGERTEGERVRFLFSADPRLGDNAGEWVRLRTIDPTIEVPDDIAHEIEVPTAKLGDRVRMRAFIGLKQKFYREGANVISVQEKLRSLQRTFEDALDVSEFEAQEGARPVRVSRKKDVFCRSYAHLDLRGTVKDEAALAALMMKGVGPAKAYGFGLIDMELETDHD